MALTCLISTCTKPSVFLMGEEDPAWGPSECKSGSIHASRLNALCWAFLMFPIWSYFFQEGPPRPLPAEPPCGSHVLGQRQQLAGHHQRRPLGLQRHPAHLLGLHQGQRRQPILWWSRQDGTKSFRMNVRDAGERHPNSAATLGQFERIWICKTYFWHGWSCRVFSRKTNS